MSLEEMINQGHIATALLLIATFLGLIAHALLERNHKDHK